MASQEPTASTFGAIVRVLAVLIAMPVAIASGFVAVLGLPLAALEARGGSSGSANCGYVPLNAYEWLPVLAVVSACALILFVAVGVVGASVSLRRPQFTGHRASHARAHRRGCRDTWRLCRPVSRPRLARAQVVRVCLRGLCPRRVERRAGELGCSRRRAPRGTPASVEGWPRGAAARCCGPGHVPNRGVPSARLRMVGRGVAERSHRAFQRRVRADRDGDVACRCALGNHTNLSLQSGLVRLLRRMRPPGRSDRQCRRSRSQHGSRPSGGCPPPWR